MPELPSFTMPDFKGSPVSFLKEVRSELAKVIWPTRAEVVKLTIIVVAVSIALGFYIGGLDLVFTKMMDLMVRK